MSNFNQVYVKGDITNIAEDASSIYLIGNDIAVQPVSLGSPYNRIINSTGQSSSSINTDGHVYGHVIHNNYLYIWGNFTKVNGVTRYNLAKLNAQTLELDLTFNPTEIYTPFQRPYLCGLILSGYLYLGYNASGSFTGLVEVNLTSGHRIRQLGTTSYLDGTGLSGSFEHIATDGQNIFVGGSFHISLSVGHNEYQTKHLVKINRVTGGVDTNFVHNLPFSPVVNSNYVGQLITSLAADSTGLYVGGTFNGYLKKLNNLNGNTIWTIQTLTRVNDNYVGQFITKIQIDPTGYYLYACGGFDKHNNQPIGGLLKVSASTGLKNDSFLQQFSLTSLKNSRGIYGNDTAGEILDFSFDNNNNLYISGKFTEITGGTSIFLTTHSTIDFAKIDTIYGRPLNNFISNGTYYNSYPKLGVINNNNIFIYRIDTYGGRPPNKLVKLLKETGLEDTTFNISFQFTPTKPYYNAKIQKSAIYQQNLYIFHNDLSKINNVSVGKFVKINLTTKSVDTTFFTSFDIPTGLFAMHADENVLYIGGNFSFAHNQTNYMKFARIDTNTGNLLNNYSVNINTGYINSIKSNGNDLYIAGQITEFNSSPVNRIVKFNKLTGTRDSNFSIPPSINGSVTNIRLSDNSLYASGDMYTENVAKRIVKLNLNSGLIDSNFLSPYSVHTQIIATFEIDLQKNYLFVDKWGGNIDILDANTGTFTNSQLPQTIKTFPTGSMLVSDGKLYTNSTSSSFYGNLTTYSTSTNLLAVPGPDNIILNPSQVLENSSENTQVGILSVNGGTAPFIFEMISGNGDTDNSSFIINNNIVRVASGVNLNYELKNIYSIRVKVTDFENYTFQKNLTINITDVNEIPIDISLSNNSIFENSAINTTIGILNGIDPDSNSLTFSIISGNNNFNINGNTLRSSIIFDYETLSTHNVTIRATDSGGLYIDKQFTIHVLNVNEAPTNILLSSNTIAENSPVNTGIGILTGNDSDLNDNLSFSVVVGTSNFNINGNELRSSVVFDHESASTQSVTIRATDSGGLYVDKQFTINVLNVNEAPTAITISNSSILENNAVGDVIGTLSATDPENNSVTFSLDTVNDYASFSIFGNQLKAATVFNRELKNLYTIRVIATDTSNNIYSQNLNISIGNRVEPPLNISLSSNQILENNLTDAIIGTLSAIDPEGGTIGFSVVSGADKFNVVSVGGIWKLRASIPFNYSIQTSHNVTIRATNANSEYADKIFTIEILEYIEPETINLTQQQYTVADSGKVYVESIYDPTIIGFLINGAALVPGSVVINTNSGQKYLKLTGNMTDYYQIPLNAKPEWVWSSSGYAIWQII